VSEEKQPMVSITGLWVGTDKNQKQYMAGNTGGVRYWVFKNTNKKNDNDPDYILKISQNIKPKPDTKPAPSEDVADDIPF